MKLESLLPAVVALAREAGQQILTVYAEDFAVEHKGDASPLTAADLASHSTILAGLRTLTPHIPVISEESAAIPFATRSTWNPYWLVDPLDGTREFVKRNGEFTVNIALIRDHVPVLGVVHVPVTGVDYYAAEELGAFRQLPGEPPQPIHVARNSGQTRVVGSRSHRGASLDAYLSRLGEHEMVPMGSSLKFCVVAEGGADVYPRLGPTSEWDTAAAQAVVEGAGGRVVDLSGARLSYNTKADILNPYFVVIGDTGRDWLSALPAQTPSA